MIGLVLLASLGVGGQPCAYSISGHVQDADTKENLAGATVRIIELEHEFVTDENGDFRYDQLCRGSYTLEVSHVGCETIRKMITISRSQHVDLLLPHRRYNLDEVVVSAGREAPASGFRQQLNAKDIETSQGFSIADALGKINGVNMLQTGSTISKPVIHGLHSIRVLTINNGVRQEGQQWGSEHAPEIDTYIADKLTVVKGVDELRYGSDAIGGVVLVDPKPLRSLPGHNAEVNTAWFSNNGQYVVSGIFEHQPEKLSPFSYRVQGTYKRGGNIRTPTYRLNNTGLEERNYSLSAGWKREHFQINGYYSEFATSLGIFPYTHVGNLSDLRDRIGKERPDDVYLNDRSVAIERPRQEVLHRLAKLQARFDANGHKFSLLLAGQFNQRREFDIVRNQQTKGPQISLSLITFSEDITYEHPAWNNFRGTIGVNLTQQDNSYSGRYLIPNYFSAGYGAYWIEKLGRNRFDVEVGLRFDSKSINTTRLQYGGEISDNDFRFSTFASSINAGYRLGAGFKGTGAVTLSSRAPHVNELLSGGIHQASGGYSFLQGDIHLKTEKSLNFNAGLQYAADDKPLSAELTFYHNIIDDFIYLQPRPDEPVLTVTGAAPKLEYEQTDATLTGADLSLTYRFSPRLSVVSRLSALRARNRIAGDWLILMPADRWRNEIAYHFNNTRRVREAFVTAEFVQVFRPRVPADKNGPQDYKEPPGAYGLVNLNASADIRVFGYPLTVGLTMRNALNARYRDYMNFFRYYSDEMGRNLIIRVKVPFENFLSKSKNNRS